MPVEPVSEVELRRALRRHRVDPTAFENGVRARLQAGSAQVGTDPFVGRSPFLRSAASYLPLAILSGCNVGPTAAQVAPPALMYKIFGWLAFPAISLFVLLGATVFSVARIRDLRGMKESDKGDPKATDEAVRFWWKQHGWGVVGVIAASITMAFIGATWLLFLMYIVSFGVLLHVLEVLGGQGLANRQMICRSCMMGLLFLAQISNFVGIGHQEIHFVDQSLVTAVFFGGVLVLLVLLVYLARVERSSQMKTPQGLLAGLAFILVPFMLWLLNPMLLPAGPQQIKRFVESFDRADFQMVSWRQWEIPAQWVIDSNLNPDLTLPRKLLEKELTGKQDFYTVGTALRVGLLPVDQMKIRMDDFVSREALLAPPPPGQKHLPIGSLEPAECLIRVSALRKDLSSEDVDLLEQRLHATLDESLTSNLLVLETILRVTQLLEVIDRPIDRDQYRDRIHSILREFHTTNTGGFQLAGGFKTYRSRPDKLWFTQLGDLMPTSHAVELMAIYGVPKEIDVNWVQSFLKPIVMRFSNDKWMAAATLARLNQLPGVTRPSWLDVLYYERTLLAAIVLVGLCIYASLYSPHQRVRQEEISNPFV